MLPEDRESHDHVQRMLNARKREELTERYGAVFSPERAPSLPPEVEAEYLNHVEEFERQYENAATTTLRAFVGNPITPPVDDIADGELDAELNQLFGILTRNDVVVHFLQQPDDRETYRFLTEDLLNEEIVDIRIPGMRHCFVYEEFQDDEDPLPE